LVACGRGPEPSALADLASVAPAVLRSVPESAPIPQDRWPAAITYFEPERVYATPEGLYIAQSSFFVQEQGLFVPRSPDFVSHAGTDPSYIPMDSGVFRYEIKG